MRQEGEQVCAGGHLSEVLKAVLLRLEFGKKQDSFLEMNVSANQGSEVKKKIVGAQVRLRNK